MTLPCDHADLDNPYIVPGNEQLGEDMDWIARIEPEAGDTASPEAHEPHAAAALVRVAPQAQDAANQAPLITGLDGDSVIQVESDFSTPYIDLGLDAVVSDPDGTDFSGARLTVAVTAGMAPTDELSITFFPPLSFNPSAHTIFWNNVEFASYTGGSEGDATLTIDFETGTTADMVQTVLRNIYLRDDATTLTDRTRTVEVTLNDGHGTDNGGSDTVSYTTQVSTVAINHAPQGGDATLTAIADQAYTFTRADFPLTDMDGNGLGGVEIDTFPANGSLLLGGAALVQFQIVTAAQIDSGALTFVPAPNASGANYDSFTFRVQDDGGTDHGGRNTDPSPHTITFDIAPPNQAPTFAASDFPVQLISIDACGCPGDADTQAGTFAPDGTYVLFQSTAGFAGDATPYSDLFIKDLITGDLVLVSTYADGDQADGFSGNASFSADGTRVLFVSEADNLVDGDTNGVADVFLKDLFTGEVTRLSTTSSGAETDGGSVDPRLSADGTKLVFVSEADNLVAGDTNSVADVFVKDLLTGEITCLSSASDGSISDNLSGSPVFSPDGTKVAFWSFASNLIPGVPAGQICLKDLVTGDLTVISSDAGGVASDGGSTGAVSFSPDGTKVAFASTSANLVAGDTNNAQDVFIKDLTTGAIERVSTDGAAGQADSDSFLPVFSPDGTKLAFVSRADNLVGGDTNGAFDVFVKDLTTGAVTRVSTDAFGSQASADSYALGFSPDGTQLLITSNADNLVPGDHNGFADLFTVSLVSQQVTYDEGAFPVQVAGSVAVGDPDGSGYDGGHLTIAITGGLVDGDVILLGPGVGIDGNGDIIVDGVAVGALNPDYLNDPTSLTVDLYATADDAAVRAIAEAVYYGSLSYDPTDVDRTITFTLTDSGGTAGGGSDTTSFTRIVHVVPFDDAPVADDDTASVAENATQVIDVAANDMDPDGGAVVPIALIDGQAVSVGIPITLSSGATVTLNVDGTITYDPNHAFDYLISSATALATGAFSDQATDSFFYAYDLCGCGAALVTVTIDGVDGPGSRASGDSGDNTITGTPQVDMFFLEQGGTDHVTGLGSNDGFYFGGAFDPTDTVDGGDGTMDQIGLQGDYSGGLTLSPTSMTGVEMLVLLSGHDARFGDTAGNDYSYDITSDDGNVGAGQTLTVQGNALGASENLTFDGSAEQDGSFAMYGGLGVDHLTGGQKDDSFYFGKDGRFGPDDTVDGQGGSDQLRLQGDYSGANGVVLAPDQVKSVDLILLASAQDTRFGAAAGLSYSYDLTTDDSTVAAGETMTIQAKRLLAGENLHFDGSHETDGAFKVYAGAGDDVIIGGAKSDYVLAGAGNDRITGGSGADNLFGEGGNDVFVYLSADDSTAAARDHILDFAAGDTIDVAALGITDFIGNAAFGNHAGEVRASFVGSFWQIEGDVDGDGTADLSILVTAPSSYAWSAGDFALASSQLRQSVPVAPSWSAGPETHGLDRDTDLGHASALPAIVQLAGEHTL